MILDHRTYDIVPGRIGELLKLYEAEGFPVQTEYLGQPYGWFMSMDIGELNQVVHIWKYESLADREQRRAKLSADPRWQAYLVKAMPMITCMRNKILRGTAFFPIR